MTSSTACLNCRIEWRASRLHVATLALLGVFAAVALSMSALPWLLALPAMTLSLGWGACLAMRERRRPAVSLQLQAGAQGVSMQVDDEPVRLVSLNLRGPLAVLVVAGPLGRRRLTWWPDTLTPRTRRTFRLLKQAGPVSPPVLPLVAG